MRYKNNRVCVCEPGFTHSCVPIVGSGVVIKGLIGVFVIHLQVGVWRDVPANTKTQKSVSWDSETESVTTNSLIQSAFYHT